MQDHPARMTVTRTNEPATPPPPRATWTLADLALLHSMIVQGLQLKEKNPPVLRLTSQQRTKFLSVPAGRLELRAPMTIHGERAVLPFPLEKVKHRCGPIPLAAASQMDLAIVVLQHAQSLGGFELINKGWRHMNRSYGVKYACEEPRPDRKAVQREDIRQRVIKKLSYPVFFELLELRATDIEMDKELQHLEPAWYLGGLSGADHNELHEEDFRQSECNQQLCGLGHNHPPLPDLPRDH